MGIDWGLAWAVLFTGLVVVFAILIILVFICWLLGKIMYAVTNRDKGDTDKPSAPAPKAPAPKAAKKSSSSPVMSVAAGIPGEVVAAISAAIACMMGGNKPFAIRSVKRSKGTRNAWNAAGIAENTRPF